MKLAIDMVWGGIKIVNTDSDEPIMHREYAAEDKMEFLYYLMAGRDVLKTDVVTNEAPRG